MRFNRGLNERGKARKKKKLDDNRKEVDIFMNWMRRDRVYYTG